MQQETEYQPMTGCPRRLHELVTMEMDPCGLQAKVFRYILQWHGEDHGEEEGMGGGLGGMGRIPH